jgi:hypothetical protein
MRAITLGTLRDGFRLALSNTPLDSAVGCLATSPSRAARPDWATPPTIDLRFAALKVACTVQTDTSKPTTGDTSERLMNIKRFGHGKNSTGCNRLVPLMYSRRNYSWVRSAELPTKARRATKYVLKIEVAGTRPSSLSPSEAGRRVRGTSAFDPSPFSAGAFVAGHPDRRRSLQ